jgi:DNA-binding transcriptional ArsR family regulator
MPDRQPRNLFASRFTRRDAEALAAALAVLSNPTALLAMAILDEHGPLLNNQLTFRLGLTQSTTSHCLAQLARAGLVTRTRRGPGMGTGILNSFDEDGYNRLLRLLHPGSNR